jgi:hypothetical protein
MNNSNIGDIALDIMIKEAVIANFNARMEALPSEEEMRKMNPPSPEHIRKMKKLFAWEKRRDFTKKMLVHTKAAALVLCVATAIFFSALMFNPEVRASVRGVIVQFFELFARVEYAPSEDTDRTAGSFVLGYIPDVYELISDEELGHGKFKVYSDSSEILLFFNVQPPDVYSGDTEQREYRHETHEGVIYHIFESRYGYVFSTVTWEQYEFMFILQGQITVDELMKMALSLE